MMGTPVVASDVGGIRSLVDDGVNGFVVRPESVGELADALRRLSGAGPRLRARCMFRRSGLRDQYGPRRWVRRMESAYRAGVERTPAPGVARGA